MKYLDLFTGIGGFTLGIEQAYDNRQKTYNNGRSPKILPNNLSDSERNNVERPLSCVGFSEIDKYATKIYQSHYPEHKNYGDITTINANEIPDFDLLVGGFPCQSFSIAGKRKGFEDTRGTLFFKIARILRTKQPRLLCLENVKGLLSHDNGNTFRTILSTLDELGYDLQWQVLNSKNFGVPQNRERVFIIGHLGGTSRPEVFPIGESNKENSVSGVLAKQGTKGIATRHLDRNGCLISDIASTVQVAETPHIIQLNQPTHSNDRVYGTDGLSPTLNTMQGGNRQPFIANTIDANYVKGNSKTKERHTPRTEVIQDSKIRRLTPTECARLQGFPDDWHKIEGISDTQAYKCYGNAVTVNVIEEIIKRLFNLSTTY